MCSVAVLVLTRTSVIAQMGLHWVSIGAGENCSQEDLDSNLLRYLHTGSTGLQREDAFIFHLQDGANRSPVQHFRISVKTMEKGQHGWLGSGAGCTSLSVQAFLVIHGYHIPQKSNVPPLSICTENMHTKPELLP